MPALHRAERDLHEALSLWDEIACNLERLQARSDELNEGWERLFVRHQTGENVGRYLDYQDRRCDRMHRACERLYAELGVCDEAVDRARLAVADAKRGLLEPNH